jgi:hypothetical protein
MENSQNNYHSHKRSNTMQNFLESLLGSNWRTSLFGIIQFIAGQAYNYIQSLAPGATFDWKIFIGQLMVAILALLAKDSKVTGGSIEAK